MEFLDALWKYLLTSAPYLLLGFLVGGVINQFLHISRIKKWFGGDKLSNVVKAAVVGIPLPLCSCSVIPTATSLRKAGASKASTSSFLIATPESGVDSISMTYGLMDLPMTIIRPVATFFSAFFAGVLQIWFNPEDEQKFLVAEEGSAVFNAREHEVSGVHCSMKPKAPDTFWQKVRGSFQYGYGNLVNDLALWLAIGILAGALIDFLVPDDFFTNLSPTASRFAVFAVGIPLYICASASTPIAVSLILKGMSPGVALIFLLVGPATNISNIAVLQKYIGLKGVILNIIAIVVVALGFSYLVDYLYGNFFPLNFAMADVHEHFEPGFWQISMGLLLAGLILKGIVVEEVLPRFKKKEIQKGCCH